MRSHPAQPPLIHPPFCLDAGVSHGDELGYLFRIGILPEIQLGPESKDLLIRKRMLKLWYNFITTG